MSNLHSNLVKIIGAELGRQEMKWSELGRKIGMTDSRMSQLRNHKAQINLKVLKKIADALNCRMSGIFLELERMEAETMGDKS